MSQTLSVAQSLGHLRQNRKSYFGRAAGADEVKRAVQATLAQLKLDARIVEVGCVGPCYLEPLLDVAAFGNPRVVSDVFSLTRNPAQARWKYDDGAYDVAGKWTSKLNSGKTQIDAVVGYLGSAADRGVASSAP